MSKHIVNCDADATPFLESVLWTPFQHWKGGLIEFDPSKIELYVSPNMHIWHSPLDGKDYSLTKGRYLRQELIGKKIQGRKILNANVLEFLLRHPDLIPEEWKSFQVFFWGTLYRDRPPPNNFYGDCIRALIWWPGEGWRWTTRNPWLEFTPRMPAAILRE